jgi:hypothetical protein
MRSSRVFLALSGLFALGACTPDPVILPVRNLERPADMGFACVQRVSEANGRLVLTGRPMSACHDPAPFIVDPASGNTVPDLVKARADHPNNAAGVPVFGTFGLITNTARGEVAVAHFPGSGDRDELKDLDPSSPGFNHIPVGGLPESIAVADDSCRAVTANGGTCDLSVIDVSSVLAPFFQGQPVPATASPDGKPAPPSSPLRIGNLRAQPREVVMLPTVASLPAAADAMAGPVCSAAAVNEVVVTFPRCSLVAIVEVPSAEVFAAAVGKQVPQATIKSSVRILPDGTVVDAGTNPVCQPECGGFAETDVPDTGAAPDADGGAGDASASDGGTSGPRPTGGIAGLAVMPDTTALYVGMVEAPYVVKVGITGGPRARTLVPLGDAGTLGLAEGAVGVTRLRLSVDPYLVPVPADAIGPDLPFVGNRGKFLYAIARDGSLRVVDVKTFVECDANIDPVAILNDTLKTAGCIRIGERPRRPLAQGPGVRIPATVDPDVPPAVPIDIAFAQVGPLATGFLLASNAQTYHLALGNAPDLMSARSMMSTTAPVEDSVSTHVFRAAPLGFNQSRAGSNPNVGVEPSRNFSSDPVERALGGFGSTPFPAKVTFASRLAGPRLEGYQIGTDTNAVRQWAYVPKGALTPPQQMSLEWQGMVAGFPRISGRLEVEPGAAGAIRDEGANFCRSGVEVGDIVTLIGCDQDDHCNLAQEEICHRAAPGAPGVCVPRKLTENEELVRVCRNEFASRRRYEVKSVTARRLTFGVKLDEVPRPAVAPCDPAVTPGTENDVCQPPSSGHGADSRLPGDVGFVCKVFTGGAPRCVKPCGSTRADGSIAPDDTRCRPGHVCADMGAEGFLCVEGPPPQPICLSTDIRYGVQVGNGFRVFAQALPTYVKSKANDQGQCEPLPNQSALLQDRISLSAPLCSEPRQVGPDRPSVLTALNGASPAPGNPCLYQALNGDETGPPVLRWKALFENPHIRFVLTNLDSYTGDAAFINFQILEGFAPLRVLGTGAGSEVALGERIVTGPMASAPVEGAMYNIPVPPYLFVIDQGRTNVDLSRGQVLRLNPRAWIRGHEGGRFDSQNLDTRFPLQ